MKMTSLDHVQIKLYAEFPWLTLAMTTGVAESSKSLFIRRTEGRVRSFLLRGWNQKLAASNIKLLLYVLSEWFSLIYRYAKHDVFHEHQYRNFIYNSHITHINAYKLWLKFLLFTCNVFFLQFKFFFPWPISKFNDFSRNPKFPSGFPRCLQIHIQ